ncbi:MAG TPA: pyrroline-5-carboxylate reductase [Dehalococcoidia bacterium]|nr:pyrroline-5-carboxylate reductase [Dehalococcoidia bacterium]
MRIGIIGGGAMGEAILAAVLRRKLATPEEVVVAEHLPGRLEALKGRHGVRGTLDAADAVDADYVIIAVKPQEFDKAASAIAGKLPPAATVVSIMAGVSVARIREALKHKAIVRTAPNTPAQVGEGMTVWTATPEVGESAQADVAAILDSMGRQLFVPDERYVDMAIAVSASGPGFVLLLIEAMIDGAVHIGVPRDQATEMVLQTFAGTARMAQETGRHPADLKNMVTSPGGTTTEGLLVLEGAGVRAALIEAIAEAYNKSKALGG